MKMEVIKRYYHFIFIMAIFMVIFIDNYLHNHVDKKLEEPKMFTLNISAALKHYLRFYQNGTREEKIYDLLDGEEKINIRNYFKLKIKSKNINQKIMNLDKFGPITADTLIILVQVHRSSILLKFLIESLRSVIFISRALVIFSHDFYSFKMNTLIQNIKFCRVMQIFYPYSMQIYPDTFPGNSDKNDGEDLFGYQRDSNLVQNKHHWWWSANTVFDKLNATKNFEGYVMFLEESNYVAPDLLCIFERMKYLIEVDGIIALGSTDIAKVQEYSINKTKNRVKSTILKVEPWHPMVQLGMSIDRDLWTNIKKFSYDFCTDDDFTWTNSLMYIFDKKFDNILLQTMYPYSPRVFQLEKLEGTDPKTLEVGLERSIKIIEEKYFNEYKSMINKNRKYIRNISKMKKYRSYEQFGGWGDSRDHNLCLSISYESDI